MNFASALSDAEVNLETNGFSTTLWVPEFQWSTSEAEASQPPHSPQLLAALQIFGWFFIAEKNRTWVHLAAEMQAGKTGVVSALVRLMFSNISRIKITPERIFVLTGMSDNAWIKQTRERLPNSVRPGVFHNGGFTKVQQSLTSLAAGGRLENILIVFDESHIASLAGNRPSHMIYNKVSELCPREEWEERNIHFLTISATDPAKSSLCLENRSSKVVRLLTNDTYQSVKSLNDAKRIHDSLDLHDPTAITELKRAVAQYPCPLYHILRPRQKVIKGKKTAAELLVKDKTMEGLLKEAFPDCVVIAWDSSTKGENTDSSSTAIEDINELLEVCPQKHTFILLKNMFYASKTMEDAHVGVLWDRKGGKDDTNLQSLLGRALGYGKSKRTIVYTSKETVENYLTFWSHAIAGLPPPTNIPVDTDRLEKKMAGVQKIRIINGQAVLTISRNYIGPGGTGVAPPVIPKVVPTVEEFSSLDTLKERWLKIQEEKGIAHKTTVRTPNKDENQMYTCALGKASIKQTVADVREYITGCTRGWTSSARMADRPAEVVHRIYVGYDGVTPTFFLRWGESKN